MCLATINKRHSMLKKGIIIAWKVLYDFDDGTYNTPLRGSVKPIPEGEWIEEKKARSAGAGNGIEGGRKACEYFIYPTGFHSFLNKEDAEDFMKESGWSWKHQWDWRKYDKEDLTVKKVLIRNHIGVGTNETLFKNKNAQEKQVIVSKEMYILEGTDDNNR